MGLWGSGRLLFGVWQPFKEQKEPHFPWRGLLHYAVPLLVRFFGLGGLGGWKLQITSPQQVVGELGSGAFYLPQGMDTFHIRNGNNSYSQVLAFFGLGLFGGTSEPSVRCVGCDVSPGPGGETSGPKPVPAAQFLAMRCQWRPFCVLTCCTPICEDINIKCLENGKYNILSEKS